MPQNITACAVTESVRRATARLNQAHYDALLGADYIAETPHLKHRSLRRMYVNAACELHEAARRVRAQPRVLDLGAGEGFSALVFLRLGARLAAIDISEGRLAQLRQRCHEHRDRLTVRCGEVLDVLAALEGEFEIVVANAFLHHVPDYLAVVRQARRLLSPPGAFFIFQESMRYDSMSRFDHWMVKLSYYSWRVFQGNLRHGLARFIAHRRGLLLPEDDLDYHLVRNGVDQEAIARIFPPESSKPGWGTISGP